MDRLIKIEGFMGIGVSGMDVFHEGLPAMNSTVFQLLGTGLRVFCGVDDNLLVMNDLCFDFRRVFLHSILGVLSVFDEVCLDFRSVLLDSELNLFRLVDCRLLVVVDLCLDFRNVLPGSGRGGDNMVIDSLSVILNSKLGLVEIILESLLGIIKVLQDISLDGW